MIVVLWLSLTLPTTVEPGFFPGYQYLPAPDPAIIAQPIPPAAPVVENTIIEI